MYPLESKTKFSGFISLCIILFACKYSKPNIVHARKNPIKYSNKYKLDLIY